MRRSGYTLIELLLVLSILLIVAAAASPTVGGLMADYRLKEATEKVRVALAATRVHAIDKSSTFQFRFEPGGRRFAALPTDVEVYNPATQTASKSNATNGPEIGELPEEFTFQLATSTATRGTSPVVVEAASMDPAWAGALAQVPNSASFTSAVWSPPIIFRPDGTASDAAVSVVHRSGHGYRLSIRELTGDITVQPMSQAAF